MITAEYQRIHILLQEEEQPHLEALKKEAKGICLTTQQRERLKAMYRELTGMCHKLDTELLQGLENVLETTDLTEMQKPQPMNPELPSWPVSGFLHMLNNFSMNNLLSQTTTARHAILDDASVMSEDDHPGVSRQPRGGGLQFVKRPLGKIGAFLDDDNGTVSFCEVFRSSLIYSFLPLLFSSPVIPFLCLKSP
ncbi:hypothetical protein Celaphus_00017820 [Cervus elaphus hippelaphus]|uniref:Uncharacterized protein n=1 Tax=Cervus elaphus hippelaphus TaxID=46360 RepID=A0A212C760_CEREH|nr:hypothetical protein Celaphus_00017820 [Cervus elaphus hippelaphus]